MAKKLSNAFLDAGGTLIQSTAIRMAICSAEPANYAGIAAVRLAEVTMASGDYALANGDIAGRKVTVAAKNGIPITTSGTGNHIVLHDNSSDILAVTTCPPLVLTAGGSNTVNSAAWAIETALDS